MNRKPDAPRTTTVVCGMPYAVGATRGHYTGQIDAVGGVPHGLGTWRSADDDGARAEGAAGGGAAPSALLLEGEWTRGALVKHTSVLRVAGRGPAEGGRKQPAQDVPQITNPIWKSTHEHHNIKRYAHWPRS